MPVPPADTPSEPGADEPATDSPTDWVRKHIRTYIESGGTKGVTFYGVPSLLLTTRGRTSGLLRRTALYYGQDGDRYLLIASNGGNHHHPSWYLNLRADPDVTVQVGPEVFVARARTASPDEKPALWQLMATMFPQYDTYQKKANREIPLVILERA
jgi:deazaflavin-dependent oxidoreductase (nitroreductase family)